MSGNILISLALNCQKLAHMRLQKEWTEQENLEDEEASDEDDEPHNDDEHAAQSPHERTALLKPNQQRNLSEGYGSNLDGSTLLNTPEEQRSFKDSPVAGGSDSDDAEDDDERKKRWSKASSGSHAGGTKFLRSKLWWLGILLMSLGEFGNFLCE